MGLARTPPSDPPPAYRYVAKVYRRNLRPIVIAMSVITAIWALAWTVSSFKQLKLANRVDLPKLAPLLIAQGVMFAVACTFQIFGAIAAYLQRFAMIKLYAFLCALSTLLVVGLAIMRVVTHFVFKSDLISECTSVVQTGSVDSVFGIWGTNPDNRLDPAQAVLFCRSEWKHSSWTEIIAIVLETLAGLLFTSLAFAYYRQSLDPVSLANASRLPSNQTRRDAYPSHYNLPYDNTAYEPVYTPQPGPSTDGKPPEYKRGSYASHDGDKDKQEDDPFSDYDGPSVPMPTHWVEDRDASPSRV